MRGSEDHNREAGFNFEDTRFLIDRHLIPSPRVHVGSRLANLHIPSAMIDVSDGLLADLNHLLFPHGLGAILYEEKIPLSSSYSQVVGCFFQETLDLALTGGEDYELLFTVPDNSLEKMQELSKHILEVPFSKIGKIESSKNGDKKGIKIINQKGMPRKIPDLGGYKHF